MVQGSFIIWMNSNLHNGVIVLWFPVFLLSPIGVFVFLSITFIKSVVATFIPTFLLASTSSNSWSSVE